MYLLFDFEWLLTKYNRFLHESLLKIWDFFHEWKKSQIFNKVEYKYLFLPLAIKTAARDLVLHGIVSQSNRPSIIIMESASTTAVVI
jgi:hypothetical protein